MIFFFVISSAALTVIIMFLPPPEETNIMIGRKRIKVNEARSLASKIAGLIGKKNQKEGNAMLFRFLIPTRKIFWTVGMQFPINIFWIKNGRIIAVSKNIPPGTPFVPSPGNVDAALEACQTFSRKNKIPDSGKITY